MELESELSKRRKVIGLLQSSRRIDFDPPTARQLHNVCGVQISDIQDWTHLKYLHEVCPKLKTLKLLSDIMVRDDENLKQISEMTFLQCLQIHLSDAQNRIETLSSLSSLKELIIGGDDGGKYGIENDVILAVSVHLPNIEKLSIDADLGLSLKSAQRLETMKNLRSLSLSTLYVDQQLIKPLCYCLSNLKQLSFGSLPIFEHMYSQDVQTMAQSLKSLKRFDSKYSCRSNRSTQIMLYHLPRLASLGIAPCQTNQSQSNSIEKLISDHQPDLKHLQLYGYKFQPKTFGSLIENLALLSSLEASTSQNMIHGLRQQSQRNSYVSLEAIRVLSKKKPYLARLSLNCQVQDKVVYAMCTSFLRLRELHLSVKCSNNDLVYLSKLRYLNVLTISEGTLEYTLIPKLFHCLKRLQRLEASVVCSIRPHENLKRNWDWRYPLKTKMRR